MPPPAKPSNPVGSRDSPVGFPVCYPVKELLPIVSLPLLVDN